MFFLSPASKGETATERAPVEKEVPIKADAPEEQPKADPFLTSDVDPSAQDVDVDINYKMERIADVSVPGLVNMAEKPGIEGGAKDMPPINLPGAGRVRQGPGRCSGSAFTGTSGAVGMPGGYSLQGMPLPGTFNGRSGSTREIALRDGGGTKESEAAVNRGLVWFVKNQHPEGKWQSEGGFSDKGSPNDTAGTAFGLLPMLGGQDAQGWTG